LSFGVDSEEALSALAARAGRAWRDAGLSPLIVGLSGPLGVGKTTFVRGLLRGLGFTGRVPSPTYTLLEHYEIGALTVVHLDLYRLAEARELEYLGLRDWLALPFVWVLVEWPERGGRLAEGLDLRLAFAAGSDEQRTLEAEVGNERGREAAGAWLGTDFK
jgi:tRNA threonylcarbamoyladenosine biosynthesis protein TsaE